MTSAVYDKITNQLIAALDQGTPPWRKPWNGTVSLPRNAVSNRAYTGVNVITLWTTNYGDPRWLTLDNSASYIQGWLRALKGDNHLAVTAASAAQRAADYILGERE